MEIEKLQFIKVTNKDESIKVILEIDECNEIRIKYNGYLIVEHIHYLCYNTFTDLFERNNLNDNFWDKDLITTCIIECHKTLL